MSQVTLSDVMWSNMKAEELERKMKCEKDPKKKAKLKKQFDAQCKKTIGLIRKGDRQRGFKESI